VKDPIKSNETQQRRQVESSRNSPKASAAIGITEIKKYHRHPGNKNRRGEKI